jgi:hypothetical protein
MLKIFSVKKWDNKTRENVKLPKGVKLEDHEDALVI